MAYASNANAGGPPAGGPRGRPQEPYRPWATCGLPTPSLLRPCATAGPLRLYAHLRTIGLPRGNILNGNSHSSSPPARPPLGPPRRPHPTLGGPLGPLGLRGPCAPQGRDEPSGAAGLSRSVLSNPSRDVKETVALQGSLRPGAVTIPQARWPARSVLSRHDVNRVASPCADCCASHHARVDARPVPTFPRIGTFGPASRGAVEHRLHGQ
jgi:hypothetical protein